MIMTNLVQIAHADLVSDAVYDFIGVSKARDCQLGPMVPCSTLAYSAATLM